MDWYIIALISAIFSAAAAVLEKKILIKENALPMAVLLSLFNLIIAVPFFFFVDYAAVSSLSLGVLFIKSLLAAAAFLCVMQAIKHLEISKALPMLVVTTGLVALFAFLILGESLKLVEIFGMVLLLAGTYILQLKGIEEAAEPARKMFSRKGNYYVLSALVIFTATSILDKALLKNFRLPLDALFAFQHLFFAVIFLVIAVLCSRNFNLKKTINHSWKLIALLALLTITYRYSYIMAVKIAPVALVLSIKRISVFFAVLIGGFYFRDENLKRRLIATAAMIIGAIMIIVN